MKVAPLHAVVLFVAMVWLRVIIEFHLPSETSLVGTVFPLFEFIHIGLLFLFLFCMMTWILKIFLHYPFQRVLILGLLLLGPFILLPPLIDVFLFSDHQILSYYEFYGVPQFIANFFTFASHLPYDGASPGQRIVIGFLLLAMIPFSYFQLTSKRKRRTALIVFLTYCVFYIIITLPSIITILVTFVSQKWLITSNAPVAELFLAAQISPPGLIAITAPYMISAMMLLILFPFNLLLITSLLCLYRNKTARALAANIRPAQVFYHIGLLSLGVAVATMIQESNIIMTLFNGLLLLNLALMTIFCWISSVVINDYFDRTADVISNSTRPLITGIISPPQYLAIGIITGVISLVISLFFGLYIFYLVLAYHSLSMIYSMPPLRLKRLPVVASILGAFAALTVVFIGYLIVIPSHDLSGFPHAIIWLLLLVHVLCLPIKDLKDIEGDRVDRVWTIPVLLGESTARPLIGTGLFLSYILSIFFLGIHDLFFWAVGCGALTFWIITASKVISSVGHNDKKRQFHFQKQSLLLYILIPIVIYVVLVVEYSLR